MNSDDATVAIKSRSGWSGWKEIVAAVGVILSMVFVGLELRQNTRAIQATVQNDLATASREYLLAVATTPELTAGYDKWINDEETTPVEDRMVLTAANALLRNLENVFLQTQLGAIDDRDIGNYGLQAPIFRSRRFREAWASLDFGAGFNAGFVELFAEANGL